MIKLYMDYRALRKLCKNIAKLMVLGLTLMDTPSSTGMICLPEEFCSEGVR